MEWKLTPSAPLLSFVDVEGGLSLPLFVLEYWLGVDILVIQSNKCPCLNNFDYSLWERILFFSSFVLWIQVLIDMHCSPSHGYFVNMGFRTNRSMVIPFERKNLIIWNAERERRKKCEEKQLSLAIIGQMNAEKKIFSLIEAYVEGK